MSKSELIRMAREAGFAINTRTGDINASHGSYNWIISRELERFAALVAAAEHKACLEIADLCADADMHASMAANAIRARSNT